MCSLILYVFKSGNIFRAGQTTIFLNKTKTYRMQNNFNLLDRGETLDSTYTIFILDDKNKLWCAASENFYQLTNSTVWSETSQVVTEIYRI